MKLKDFLKDKVFVYITSILIFLLMVLFLAAFHSPIRLTVILSVIFWLFILTIEAWDFMRKNSFYNDLTSKLDSLDKKYLISEMIKTPSFLEGKILNDVLHETDKSMVESVSAYRRNISEFREFIEIWVHEIKLPISSLLLMSHNHKSEISSKAHEQLRRIDNYTDQVLYYARSENAEKDYLIKQNSLKRVVSNTALKNREDLLLNNVQIKTEDLDVDVMTDSKWIEYILGQLLTNSMKYFSNDRAPIVNIYAEDFSDRTVLHFIDNGIGIPASDLPYIFEKSFTGENGRIHAKSTGMGLYIVKNLCDRLGHNISLRSIQNEFTEFTITFAKNDFIMCSNCTTRTLQNCNVM